MRNFSYIVMIFKPYCRFVTWTAYSAHDQFFQPWFLQNQYHPVVIDIGAGGAGNDQIVELLEENIGVMDGE
jgi:hypothetical protein